MLRFRIVPGEHAVCRLPPTATAPAVEAGCWCVLRTAASLTVYCRAEQAPPGAEVQGGWALLELEGSFDFAQVGVLARWLAPLAAAGIPIMALSSFETDYLLLDHARLAQAVAELAAAGIEQLPA